MAAYLPLSGQNMFNAVNSSNKLGEMLYKPLHQKQGNFAFSPFAISSLLSITYFTASNETKMAIEKALQFSDNPNIALMQFARLLKQIQDPRMNISNSIWLQGSAIKNRTEDVVNNSFGLIFRKVDFNKNSPSIVQGINRMAAIATKGKVMSLLEESNLSADMRLLLIDLFYLKGEWQVPFQPNETHEGNFQIDPIKAKPVKMMQAVGEFAYSSSDRFFLLELPLAQPKGIRKEISFYLLLPKQAEWMLSIEENFNVGEILQAARGVQKNIIALSLPMFDISELLSLREPLDEIGLKAIFLNSANFSKIIKEGGVDKFFHASPLSLNEYGVEGPDAPVKQPKKAVKFEENVEFTFDRPFLFFAIDKTTGIILLIGRISEP